MLTRIKSLVAQTNAKLIEIYRYLHANPELSGQEYETGRYVADILRSFEISVQEGIGRTGVVGEIVGQGLDERVLAIRADLDALPIQELTELDFASCRPGIMHACGHDLHTTVVIGTVIVLSAIQEFLSGKTRFIFQPAEETVLGATWMLQDRVLEQTSAIIGLHSYPNIPAGSVGIRYGTLTASSDSFEIEILGTSGDAGEPHNAVDAVWIAAQVIVSLQLFISQTCDPLKPVVLTVGTIEGGKYHNLIADKVSFSGTVRSTCQDMREKLPQELENVVRHTCDAYGAEYRFMYMRGVPPVNNDQVLTSLIEKSAREILGNDRVQIISKPSLGGEDFAFYLNRCPGAMFRVGVGKIGRKNYPLHHPKFEVDESAIAAAVSTLVYTVYQYWKSP